MNNDILKALTYGMFVLSTKYEERAVGCFVNTVIQITSQNKIIAVSVNKDNFTNIAIKQSKKFVVSILSEQSNPEVIGKFGFFSSRDVDKFKDFNVYNYLGMPIVNENISGYVICELVDVVSVESHDIFLAKIIDGEKINDFKPMTYSYYHSVIKGKAPKSAPTYIEETVKSNSNSKIYRCIICGHIYDEEKEKIPFDELPEDWRCPICGVGIENFKLME